MPTIIGFEIKVENIDTIFKLSQDKEEISYENIIDKLEKKEGNNSLIAIEMKKNELFQK